MPSLLVDPLTGQLLHVMTDRSRPSRICTVVDGALRIYTPSSWQVVESADADRPDLGIQSYHRFVVVDGRVVERDGTCG